MRSWRRKRESTGLEAELRANRPEPSRELLYKLEARVREDGRRSRAGSFRIAFAGALAGGVLAALASVGGLAYATTGVGQAVEKATRVVHKHGVTTLHKSAARSQYSKPKAKCPKGKKRVRGKCKKVKKARGVNVRRPPYTVKDCDRTMNRRGGRETAPSILGHTLRVMNKRFRRSGVALVALVALVLAVGAGAGTARGPKLTLSWQTPTPADGSAFTVSAGSPVSVELAASSSQPQLVLIGTRGLPAGASLAAAYGRPGLATVNWTPTEDQVGEHVLTFTAQTHDLPHAYARPRSFLVYVLPSAPAARGEPFPLNGPNGMSRSAYVLRTVAARAQPSSRAKVITRLRPQTPERTRNIALALTGQINEQGAYWVRVRLPILPNGSTGWVPRTALGGFNRIWTHLVIDRALFTATLYRRGVPVFQTRVGVGKAYWPTPAGEFYVRERITGFSDLIYGPIAFGTNARSAVLTDWPGGGFIGIHGTNQPEILPGRVSHGCVRMPNSAVRRLSRLMPLGTPVTIT